MVYRRLYENANRPRTDLLAEIGPRKSTLLNDTIYYNYATLSKIANLIYA